MQSGISANIKDVIWEIKIALEGMPCPRFGVKKVPTTKKSADVTAAQLREAAGYAYTFIKPRRFLKEIKIEGRHEIHVFGKNDPLDPDEIDFELPNGEKKKFSVQSLDIVTIDNKRKLVYRSIPSKKMGVGTVFRNGGSCFPLLVSKGWGTFSELKTCVHELIRIYLKHKFFSEDESGMRGENNTKRIAVEALKVMSGRFRHNIAILQRILGGKIWQQLNPEASKLAMQICGPKANSLDYTLIWNNLEEVKDTFAKAPGVLPVWLCLAKRILFHQRNGEDRTKEANNGYLFDSNHLFMSNEHYTENDNFHLPNIIQNTKLWMECQRYCGKGVEYKSTGIFAEINNEETELRKPQEKEPPVPITPAGWKYLTHLKPAWVRRINMHAHELKTLNIALNFLAKTGQVPRLTLMKRIAGAAVSVDYTPTVDAFIRACVAATKNTTGIKHFWDAQGSLVWDWLTRENPVLDKNQLKAPWSWFMRQQAEWHERIQKIERDALAKDSWDSAIETFDYKGYTVVPLLSSLELFDEGKEMHHCVSSYARQCLLGTSRIFSIRKGEYKIATVEINDGFVKMQKPTLKWTMAQVRGKCNASVDKDVEQVAQQIAVLYNKACEKESQNVIAEAS